MSENLHDIDKLFQDGLGPMEEMPSGKVWEQLDHALDKKHLAQTRHRYSRLKWYAAALLLLLIGTLVFQLSRKEQPQKPGVVTAPSHQRQEQSAGANSENNDKQTPLVGEQSASRKGSEASTDDHYNSAEEKVPGVEKTTAIADKSVESSGQGSSEIPSVVNNRKANAASETGNAKTSVDRKISAGSAGDAAKVPASADLNRAKLRGETTVNMISSAAKARERRRTKRIGAGNLSNSETASLSTTATDGAIKNSAYSKTHPELDEKRKKQNVTVPDVNIEENSSSAVANNDATVAVTSQRMAEGRYLSVSPQLSSLSANVAEPVVATPGIAYVPPVMKKVKASLHFSLMPYFAPQFTSTRVEKDEQHVGGGGPQRPPEPERIRSSESYSSSAAAGIMGELALGKNWSVQTGIGYIARSITIQPKKIFAEKDNDGKIRYRFDCSGGYTYIDPKAGTSVAVGDSTVTTASVTRLGYISVPLMVNYSFGASKRFSIVPGAGIVGNFRVKQKIETGLEAIGSTKENFTRIQGLRSTYFNVTAGVALQYNLNRRLSINVMPAGNWAISSINQNAVVKSYPNAFSIQGGLKIHL